jgi:hypothetical protein
MPKFGVNALATSSAFWCFWYGGTNNKWRIYYTMSTDSGANWQKEVQLPVPKGLTSVAQPCAMFRPVIGSATNQIEVTYAGYSSYHKNTDIYLSRYAWNATKKRLELQGLTEQNEALTRSATEPVWYARDVDWVADEADDFNVSVVAGTTTYDLTTGKAYTVDSATGARVYSYADDDTLRSLFRAVVIDPAAGTVRFMRTPPKSAVVQATYTAMATRLTVDSVSDVAPITFWDRGENPRYSADKSAGNFRFAFPGGVNTQALTDRLWIFWKRPGVDKTGTGIHYGTFRYSVDLDMSHPIKKGAPCPVGSIVGDTLSKPAEIDWIKNRLYFMSEDAGKTFQIRYTDTTGVVRTVTRTVSLQQEIGQDGGRSFGNLTRLMVNEGQVSAFKDPLENKVWIFWTSTRSGNTDIYYETISPRFYGAEY